MRINPKLLLPIGVLLMLVGAGLPFLMVIHIVESTFFLNFLSSAASTIGLALGLISIAVQEVSRRSKDKKEDSYKR
ncbi:MAG: hypothetical protein OZ914_07865 [Anaerolineaceae bacterium]|jgi:hypothetical protein|nr:hypothetical protein [Anaerolineaceae bacterium]OQY90106.1 MAG: hypothetical protein B6D38_04845 [Anaerolineae bacterium UTCFX1]